MSATVSAYLVKRDSMRAATIALMLTIVTQAGALFSSKLHAGSHALEFSLESCNHAKAFAKLVLEKRGFALPLSFYGTIGFISPAALEIVFAAYEVDLATSVSEQQEAALKFSEKWFQREAVGADRQSSCLCFGWPVPGLRARQQALPPSRP